MTTYAIGDIQGCYDPFQRLLDKLNFDPAEDKLWLAGDLINRGPKSLETLRFIISLGDSAQSILGNHECHFLAIAKGHKAPHRIDTFSNLLAADDSEQLIDWVQSQPFFYHDDELGYSMLHAGVPPQWSLSDTKKYALELESVFQSPAIDSFLAAMYGNSPNRWDENLTGHDRLRFIINCFTRLRYCDKDGQLNFKEKGALGTQPSNLVPWFNAPNRQTINDKLLFGHWSTLGLHQSNKATCLDSGCLWGDSLSAIALDGSEQITSVDCKQSLSPF